MDGLFFMEERMSREYMEALEYLEAIIRATE